MAILYVLCALDNFVIGFTQRARRIVPHTLYIDITHVAIIPTTLGLVAVTEARNKTMFLEIFSTFRRYKLRWIRKNKYQGLQLELKLPC